MILKFSGDEVAGVAVAAKGSEVVVPDTGIVGCLSDGELSQGLSLSPSEI